MNERRALLLFEELVDDSLFTRVRRASKKQNTEGIDILAVVISRGGEEVHIPFQVKSSAAVARDEILANTQNTRMGKISYIVVNDNKSDEEIKKRIRRGVNIFLRITRENQHLVDF